MAGGRRLTDPELEALAQRIAQLSHRERMREKRPLPMCEECGHRHRSGYCAETCARCIEEED